MKNIEVVIVDDEPRAIDLLAHYISKVDFLEVKNTFRSSLKAFQYLNMESIDLLFLDINMPHLNGLDLFKNLRDIPNVIFTTAHSEYAVDGFDLNAIDYLLKPINFPRFLRACEKVQRLHSEQKSTKPFLSDVVYIKNGHSSDKFYWSEINYLEKDDNYIVFHLENGKRVLSRQTLRKMEKVFPSYVVRIHRSYAVSLHNISSVESNFIMVRGTKLPIGRNYKKLFHEKFKLFNKLL